MTINYSLPRCLPEKQGIPSAAVLDFLKHIKENNLELHSFMLLRHGSVVAEGWWHPYSSDRPHMLFSLSKSFTSTAIGMAVSEGLLSVEDKVKDFFPEEVPSNIDENLAIMRVKHLLSMSTGHKEDASNRTFNAADGNWVKAFFQIPVDYAPGTHFVYNTAATYMLSAILQKVTGQTLLNFLTPRLFEPLGINNPTWESCPKGINTGGFGLSIRTEDIAKFGQLYLQKGLWQGKRLIDEAWIEEATSAQISNGTDPDSDWAQGYGYQFWRCRNNAYRGDGAFGQYCIVMPEKDSVLAITSGVGNMQKVLDLVWTNLLPQMSPEELHENTKDSSELVQVLENLKLNPVANSFSSKFADMVSGKTYKVEQNNFNIEGLQFEFGSEKASLRAWSANKEHKIVCGTGTWEGQISDVHGSPEPLCCSGGWVDSYTFRFLCQFVETPFCYTMNCRFDEKNVEISISVNVGFGQTDYPSLLRGTLVCD